MTCVAENVASTQLFTKTLGLVCSIKGGMVDDKYS